MAAVERTGRIERVVAFEGEEPEKRDPVERGAERFERGPQRALGRRERVLVEPENAIAPDIAALHATLAVADAGGTELASDRAPPGFCCQRGHKRHRKEVRDDRTAVGGNPFADLRDDCFDGRGGAHVT